MDRNNSNRKPNPSQDRGGQPSRRPPQDRRPNRPNSSGGGGPNNQRFPPNRSQQGRRNQNDGRRDRFVEPPQDEYNRNHVVIAKAKDRDDQVLQNFEQTVVRQTVKKNADVVFFDNLAAAKTALEDLRKKSNETDQLNIVIRSESSMDDPELNKIGKVFAGAAWTLIHERRVQDGYYEK